MLLPYHQTHRFSALFLAYISQANTLQPFYRYPFTMQGIEQSIAHLEQYNYNRPLLSDVLQKQYSHTPCSNSTQQNIAALRQNNTLAIVTAHQPNLLTGPLYFIYKIVSTIKLAQQLQQQYPAYHFVPIYYMGSEDHDFAEINHLHLYGKTLSWQQNDGGAVGRLSTQTLHALFEDELRPILGKDPTAEALFQTLKACYLEQPTLADATRAWVNHLFGKYGLLVLNPDDQALKQGIFKAIALAEITRIADKQPSSYHWVQQTNQALREANYSTQAFPRSVNLFYLTQNSRERIEATDNGGFKTSNNSQFWTAQQLCREIDEHADRFSPNVILRPLYQQSLLPAIAWVGGGGELAYWLQLQSVFKELNVHYPVLIPRNSALWIEEQTSKKMKNLSLDAQNLFEDTEQLVIDYVNKNTTNQLDLSAQKQMIATAFEQIAQYALQIDPSLRESVSAEIAKLHKSIENIESKLLRAEKRNFETASNQIRAIKEKLFPQGNLQERYDNMLPYYLKYGDDFIATLLQQFQPFDKQFSIIMP